MSALANTDGVAYLVIYEGAPDDREAFLDYYLNHHLPIIWTWPAVRKVEVELGTEGGDHLANPAGVFLIARFTFDNLQDLQTALQSEGRRRAREDSKKFPAFHGTMRHQAVEILNVPR